MRIEVKSDYTYSSVMRDIIPLRLEWHPALNSVFCHKASAEDLPKICWNQKMDIPKCTASIEGQLYCVVIIILNEFFL